MPLDSFTLINIFINDFGIEKILQKYCWCKALQKNEDIVWKDLDIMNMVWI